MGWLLAELDKFALDNWPRQPEMVTPPRPAQPPGPGRDWLASTTVAAHLDT